jgi:UDP-glucose 6-dehydrogenase
MRIVVVGSGNVGSASGKLFEPYHEVQYVDVIKEKCPEQEFSWNKYTEGEVYLVCVPEKQVMEPFQWLPKNRLIIIRSTLPLGTCEVLMKEFNMHVCHVPCFSLEANMIEGEKQPSRLVIGECCREHGKMVERLWRSTGVESKVFQMKLVESELTKLVANAFLCVHISFWNEIALLCSRHHANVETVANAVTSDKRVGKYGTLKFLEPYQGRCLPKDIQRLICKGFPLMLVAAEQVNENVRKL